MIPSMRRTRVLAALLALLWLAAGPPSATEPVGARVIDGSAETGFFGRVLTLRLRLEGTAPFRVFTLDAPPRLVLDLRGAVDPGFALEPVPPIAAVGFGAVQPGWTRLVLELESPMSLESAELRAGPPAVLEARLRRASREAFAATSGAPPGAWAAARRVPAADDRRVTVALDAGHGGLDPGAVREGLREKDVTLAFAAALARALEGTGRVRAALTREGDAFLGLGERVGLARAAGADAMISIHTNAADEDNNGGAIVFTRSETGSDDDAAARARVENEAGGFDALEALAAGDPLRDALAGMARVETDARSAALADALVEALASAIGPLAPFPRRSANFIVLGAADLPSVLLEIGFLSNQEDRRRMTDPAWRERAAAAAAEGVLAWLERDRALAAKLRR